MPAPTPENERERLKALYDYSVLDTQSEQAFDDLTLLAAHICDTPIALVSLIDENRQWFKSKVGIDAQQTDRDLAFCAHAILRQETLIIPDATKDERFVNNALVTEDPKIRFYAGAPLRTPDNLQIGTLCVIDRVPHELSESQRLALEALARQVVSQLELRSKLALLKEKHSLLEKLRKLNDEFTQGLKIKNEELEQFAYIASHDLKAPLRGVSNLALWIEEDIQKSGLELPGPVAEHIEDMKEQISRMERLLDGILEYARAGHTNSHVETVDIADLVDAVVELASVPEGFQVVRSGDFPVIASNRTALQRVLLNLTTNAVKHHDHDQGQVAIHCDSLADRVRILISDDGPGIPAEYHERVFRMFERLSSTSTADGSGIGLSTVKRLTESYGGSVSIVSGEGRGTTFQLEWPVRPGATDGVSL